MVALTAYSEYHDEYEKVEPERPEITVPDETMYPIHDFIPDISAYQEAIDMDKFCAGNDFAIFRARVNSKDDAKFTCWAVELKKRGFTFAVYDYLKLKSEADAVEQADAMYAVCAPYDPKIYYLDTEELADGMTYEVERELIKVYVNRLREHGVKIIGQYTGDYCWRTSYREIEFILIPYGLPVGPRTRGRTRAGRSRVRLSAIRFSNISTRVMATPRSRVRRVSSITST